MDPGLACYSQGLGCVKNEKQALHYYKLAAKKNSAARIKLAESYVDNQQLIVDSHGGSKVSDYCRSNFFAVWKSLM